MTEPKSKLPGLSSDEKSGSFDPVASIRQMLEASQKIMAESSKHNMEFMQQIFRQMTSAGLSPRSAKVSDMSTEPLHQTIARLDNTLWGLSKQLESRDELQKLQHDILKAELESVNARLALLTNELSGTRTLMEEKFEQVLSAVRRQAS